jgi:hypothetical protein
VTLVICGNYIVLNIFLAIAVESLNALTESTEEAEGLIEYLYLEFKIIV